jgi:hypothetical protein
VQPVSSLKAQVNPLHRAPHRLVADGPLAVGDADLFALEVYARGAEAWKLFQSPYNAAGSEVAQDPVGAQHYLRLSPRRRHASAAH